MIDTHGIRRNAEHIAKRAADVADASPASPHENELGDMVEDLADCVRDLSVLVGNLIQEVAKVKS